MEAVAVMKAMEWLKTVPPVSAFSAIQRACLRRFSVDVYVKSGWIIYEAQDSNV